MSDSKEEIYEFYMIDPSDDNDTTSGDPVVTYAELARAQRFDPNDASLPKGLQFHIERLASIGFNDTGENFFGDDEDDSEPPRVDIYTVYKISQFRWALSWHEVSLYNPSGTIFYFTQEDSEDAPFEYIGCLEN